MSEKRVCNICRNERDISEFLKIKGKRRGRCKSCRTEYNKNKKEYRDTWYLKNRPRISLLKKEYAERNKEKIQAYKAHWHLENKEKMNEISRLNYQNSDKDRLRDKELQKHYGISLEQRNQILEGQGGGCAICGAVNDLTGKELAVDHCHATGIVRGILCSLCNTGIGMLGDDSTSLRRALEYLLYFESNIENLVNTVNNKGN